MISHQYVLRGRRGAEETEGKRREWRGRETVPRKERDSEGEREVNGEEERQCPREREAVKGRKRREEER